MRLFVTGSTGFIGSHFLHAALARGHEVVALRYPGSHPVIPIPDSDSLTWIDGDLNSFLTDVSAFQPFSLSASRPALVHLAAAGVNPRHATWDACFETNVHQSIALWRRAAAMDIKRFVICGSCFEYGLVAEQYEFIPPIAPLMPTGAYHASKAAATMAAIALAVEQNLNLSVLRPFHVFGEGEGPDRLWPSLRKAALAGEDFPMTPGEQIRDFVPVEQVAQAFLQAVEPLNRADVEQLRADNPPHVASSSPQPLNPSSSSSATRHPLPVTAISSTIRIANIGTGRPQTLRAFAEHWWKKWGAKGKLLPGAIPYRDNEVMRYVPEVSETLKR